MSSLTNYPHISIDPDGKARIGETRYKVAHLAREHYHYGWSGEELLRQHPDLRPEEVYAALAYFYDHHEDFIREMKLVDTEVEARRAHQTLSRDELLGRSDEPADDL